MTNDFALAAAFLVAVLHISHSNLAINLRLAVKKNSPGVGVFCFDFLNLLICKFGRGNRPTGLQYVCRDKCFTAVTVIKTIIMAAFYLYCAGQYEAVAETYLKEEDSENWVSHYKQAQNIAFLLKLFAYQHGLFLGFRIVYFIFV